MIVALNGLRSIRIEPRLRRARLDVSWTIAKALLHPQREADAFVALFHASIDTVATAGWQLNAKPSDRGAVVEAVSKRIARGGPGLHFQEIRLIGTHEAGRAKQHGSPGLTLAVGAAQHQKRLVCEKLAMLVRHEAADDDAPLSFHLIAHADFRLHHLLSVVKGRAGFAHAGFVAIIEGRAEIWPNQSES
jgi:hypothetical protein